MSNQQPPYPGQAGASNDTSDLNVMKFIIRQALAEVQTAMPVKVVAVTTADQVGPVGFVDVQPLVKMIDGLGTASSHGTLHNLPYFRLQGGKNAIIIDPQVGDIGVAVFASRDISAVKNNKAESQPGSRRMYNFADGMYFGGILNAAPTQWVRFTIDGDGNPTGIDITDVNGNTVEMLDTGTNITDKNGNVIVMNSGGITINGVLFDRSQNVTNLTEATSKSGVTLTKHQHHQGDDTHGDTEVDVGVPFN